MLHQAALYWSQCLEKLRAHPALAGVTQAWLTFEHALLICAETECQAWPDGLADGTPKICFLDPPRAAYAQSLWQGLAATYLGEAHLQVDWGTVSERFFLTPRWMLQVILHLAQHRSANETLTTETVMAQCLNFAAADLQGLATRDRPRVDLSDVIVSDKLSKQLGDIQRRMQYQPLLADLGLKQVQAGLQVLFWGKPGTGKTLGRQRRWRRR